jgi:type II secretion system protein C
MAELARRTHPFAGLVGWLALVGSAFLSADLLSASLERHLQAPPRPLESIQATSRTPSPPRSLTGVHAVLRQPQGQSPASSSSLSGRSPAAGEATLPVTGGLQGVSLKGTLVAGETRLAFLEAAGSTVAVGIGQEIGGARVTRVESTWVGLRRGSQDFLLELESMKPPQSSPGASTLRPGDPTAQPLVSGAGTGAEGPVATGRLSLDEIRAQLDNPSRMAQEVRVVPKARDGQTYGVMLEFRKADNLMARLGLQHSDVLLAVNGSAIRGAEDLYRAYMTLRNAEALEFQVERGQEQTTVRYELAR